MKKTFFWWLLPALLFTGCGPGVKRKIEINNDHVSIKIEYAGDVELAGNDSSIAFISTGGYVKYKRDDVRMVAEPDANGVISYKLYNGGREQPLDEKGKKMLIAIIQDMARIEADQQKKK
ncbi:hypothetical protein [Sediminibacterium ginsengisoli]|uniref:Lipoprotein n=1 Tax=Sediminibacterium ginsengisoli TaxID=413434 RepID=A0A1T4PJ86_9BACT|nr:hypothetical protein [Sediminibacterium ginsengisoli]SJZ90928.1 hypothetical protein SAMN04488132_10613 [Sediminibacterium ginsengisoli]